MVLASANSEPCPRVAWEGTNWHWPKTTSCYNTGTHLKAFTVNFQCLGMCLGASLETVDFISGNIA